MGCYYDATTIDKDIGRSWRRARILESRAYLAPTEYFMLSIVVGDLKVPQGGDTRIGGRVCKRHSQLLIVPMEQRLCVFIHWAPSDWY